MDEAIYLLEALNVVKVFGTLRANDDVTLRVKPGEIHAFLGENGAGKSTLIKIITGVHQPDSGEVFLDGNQVRFANTREAQEHGIAAIYQEPSLFPDLDVAENKRSVSSLRISVSTFTFSITAGLPWSFLLRPSLRFEEQLGIIQKPFATMTLGPSSNALCDAFC